MMFAECVLSVNLAATGNMRMSETKTRHFIAANCESDNDLFKPLVKHITLYQHTLHRETILNLV